MFQSIVFWLAVMAGVLFISFLALAVAIIRAVHNFLTKEEE